MTDIEIKPCPNGCGVSVMIGNHTWCLEREDAERLLSALQEYLK